MGQVLHGCARTTEAVRREIQNSKASLIKLAAQYGINPKTVAKWRQRDSVQDAPMGSAEGCPVNGVHRGRGGHCCFSPVHLVALG